MDGAEYMVKEKNGMMLIAMYKEYLKSLSI